MTDTVDIVYLKRKYTKIKKYASDLSAEDQSLVPCLDIIFNKDVSAETLKEIEPLFDRLHSHVMGDKRGVRFEPRVPKTPPVVSPMIMAMMVPKSEPSTVTIPKQDPVLVPVSCPPPQNSEPTTEEDEYRPDVITARYQRYVKTKKLMERIKVIQQYQFLLSDKDQGKVNDLTNLVSHTDEVESQVQSLEAKINNARQIVCI